EPPPLQLERQAFVVDAHQVQDRRLQVVDVNGAGRERMLVRVDWMALVVGDVVAVGIGLPVGEPAPYPGARQPDREAARMVVAPIIGRRQLALRVTRSPEFAAPD